MCGVMMSEWGDWIAIGSGGLVLILVLLSIAALAKYLFFGGHRGHDEA